MTTTAAQQNFGVNGTGPPTLPAFADDDVDDAMTVGEPTGRAASSERQQQCAAAFRKQHQHHHHPEMMKQMRYTASTLDNNHNHSVERTVTTSPSNHHQDSDCGSSSGLGGTNNCSSDSSLLDSDSRDSGGGSSSAAAAAAINGGASHKLLDVAATLTPSSMSGSSSGCGTFAANIPPPMMMGGGGVLPIGVGVMPPPLPPPPHHLIPPVLPPPPLYPIDRSPGGVPPMPSISSPSPMKHHHLWNGVPPPPMEPPPAPTVSVAPARPLYTLTCEAAAMAAAAAAAAGYQVSYSAECWSPTTAGGPPSDVLASSVANGCTGGPTNANTACSGTTAAPAASGGAAPTASSSSTGAGGGASAAGATNSGAAGSLPLNDGAALPPGVPASIAAAVNSGHDLFVHIHAGDSISLAVGNEIQHIPGPATIRMVSQAAPTSAIPMNVPPGHVVQQLLDRQGILNHIIMSQEALSGNAAAAAAAAAMAAAGAYSPLAASSSPNAVLCSRTPGSSLPPPKSTSAVQQQQQRSGATTPHKYQQQPNGGGGLTSAGAASATTFSLSQQQQQVPPPPPWSLQQQQQQQRASLKSTSPLMLMPCAPLMAPGGGMNVSSEFMMEQNFHPAYTPQQRKWTAPPNFSTVPLATGGKRGSTHSNYSGESTTNNHAGPYQAHLDGMGPEALKGQQPQPQLIQQSFGGGSAENDTASTARYGIEEDERERLCETLNNIQPPVVARVGARDADIMWQELDTSEAAASGGPFPQIDASEFTYEIFVYEGLQAPRCVMQHRCTSSAGGSAAASTSAAETVVAAAAPASSTSTGSNGFCLTQLKPATDYLVNIRASLPERLLCGNASPHAPFRTLPTRPDPPPLPKLFQRQSMTSINVGWRTPPCNGSPITAYTLQIAKNKSEHFETVYEGLLEQWRITGLDPNAYYRIRLLARNEFGTSEPSAVLSISGIAAGLPHPLIGGPPPPPHPHSHQPHPYQGGASSYVTSQQHPNTITSSSSAAASHHYVTGQHHPPPPPPPPPSSHPKSASASSYSSSMVIGQPHHHPPMMSIIQKPSPPTVLSVSARGVRLSWSVNNDFATMTLEMCDYNRSNPNVYSPVPNECYSASGTFAGVNGLQSNREYRFRLVGSTASGESLRSDYVAVKTHKDRYENANYHQSGSYPYAATAAAAASSSATHAERKELRNVVASTLPPPVVQLQKVTDEAVELMWRMPRDNHHYGNPHELAYAVEASLCADDGAAPYWTARQRCSATTATVHGAEYTMFRVQALNQRRQITSPWSEVLHVKRTATAAATPSASGSTPSSPAATAGGRHKRQQQQQQSQAVPTRKGSAIATAEKQQQQQQQPHKQQQPVEQQPVKQQTPPPPLKPANCSAPRFSAVTHESARVSWRTLDGKKEPAETASEAASAPEESDAQKASIIYELQRVDKQPPLIVYSGNAFEHVLSGLRPVEHLQARVRAVALDTDGHRVEGAWSGVGSACTPCTVATAPLRLRCRASDAPPFSDDEADVETDDGGGSGSSGTSSRAASAAAAAASASPSSSAPISPAKTLRATVTASATVASEAAGGRPSVWLAWDAPAQLNGSSVIEYVINALRYAPVDAERPSTKLEQSDAAGDAEDDTERKWRQLTEEPERLGVVDGGTRRFHAERLSYAQRYRFTVVAVNEAGASPSSAAVVWTTPAGRPDAPQHLMAKALSVSAVRLRWTRPRVNGSPLVDYHVLVYRLTAIAESELASEADTQPPAQLPQHHGKTRHQRGRAVEVVRSHRHNHHHQHHHHKRVLSSQLTLPLTDVEEEQVADEGGRPTVTYMVDGLETETLYEFTVEATNAVGVGVRAERTRCATLAPPPAPPMLALADATANSLKLRWANAPPQAVPSKSGSARSEASYYQLERMNESGTFSPVYEGELRSAKVKGLKERCTYRFRIRAALSRDNALGAWSDVQAFTTTRQPPPGVRAAPTAVAVRDVDGVWQLEWSAVRCGAALLSNAAVEAAAENDDSAFSAVAQQPTLRSQLVYRLQVAQKNSAGGTAGFGGSAVASREKESWRIVYEGASTTATVTLPPAVSPTVTRQARVFVVQKWFRVHDDTVDEPLEECVSAPSPVGLFPPTAAQQSAAVAIAQRVETSVSPRKRAIAKAAYAAAGSASLSPVMASGGGRVSVYRRLRRCLGWLKKTVSEKDCALIVLTIFVALAISIAVLLNSYYEF